MDEAGSLQGCACEYFHLIYRDKKISDVKFTQVRTKQTSENVVFQMKLVFQHPVAESESVVSVCRVTRFIFQPKIWRAEIEHNIPELETSQAFTWISAGKQSLHQ